MSDFFDLHPMWVEHSGAGALRQDGMRVFVADVFDADAPLRFTVSCTENSPYNAALRKLDEDYLNPPRLQGRTLNEACDEVDARWPISAEFLRDWEIKRHREKVAAAAADLAHAQKAVEKCARVLAELEQQLGDLTQRHTTESP